MLSDDPRESISASGKTSPDCVPCLSHSSRVFTSVGITIKCVAKSDARHTEFENLT